VIQPGQLRIEPSRAALLVVDIQERLAAVMPAEARAAVEKNVGILVELARRLAIPVVVSEQYPKGLGRTTAAVEQALVDVGARRIEKLDFGCADAPPFRDVFAELRRDQWIVAGMEAHVCVYQTVRGLVAEGVTVHVPRDAVVSRTRENLDVGLDLIARAGGVVTSTEVVVFDALKRAGTDEFRALSKLIK
jgi:nicotinamidase-related amidase